MAPPSTPDRWRRPILAVSALLCAAVAFLMVGPRPDGVVGWVDVSGLPAVNASLNAVTSLLLVAGFAAVRAGRRRVHRALMLTAFTSSAGFLCSYVVYHWFSAGPTRYVGDWRGPYLFVLFTHIVLAAAILPLALTTLARALSGDFARHRRLARPTLAVWLYVSVTGVLIFWMTHG